MASIGFSEILTILSVILEEYEGAENSTAVEQSEYRGLEQFLSSQQACFLFKSEGIKREQQIESLHMLVVLR